MTQTVSLFHHSLACRKKVTFCANSDVRNLSIFNRLRWAPKQSRVRQNTQGQPTSFLRRLGANHAPNHGPSRASLGPFLLLIQTEESLLEVIVLPLVPAKL